MAQLVEADHLRKQFGPIVAVDDISLQVAKGEVLGFLGPNGAGKSTTMKMITGFLAPDRGTARVAGFDITAEPRRAKQRIGYLPEGAPSYGDMTVKAFLGFIAEIRGFDGAERQRRVAGAVEKTALGSVVDQSIETLSKGYRRRVGLAQAILHDPAVLILDEPTDGLDPNQKQHVRELIVEMARDKAIIVSTHILEEVEAVCRRAVIIDKGRIVADGTADELQRRMPYHNAVALRLAASAGDAMKAALGGLASVVKVETLSERDGKIELRAMPRNGASIAADVAGLVRERGIAVEELHVERGKLDDVFRQITTGDTAAHSTAKTGGQHA